MGLFELEVNKNRIPLTDNEIIAENLGDLPDCMDVTLDAQIQTQPASDLKSQRFESLRFHLQFLPSFPQI